MRKERESWEVHFKFRTNERIATPLDDVGIITLASINESGEINYFVKTKTGSTWWSEVQLLDAEIENIRCQESDSRTAPYPVDV